LLFIFNFILIFFIFQICFLFFWLLFFYLKSFFKLIFSYNFTLILFFSNKINLYSSLSFDFLLIFLLWQVLQLIFLKWFIINFLIGFRTRVSQVVSFWDLSRSRMFVQVCLVFFSPSSKIKTIFSFHPSLFIQLNTGFLFFSLFFCGIVCWYGRWFDYLWSCCVLLFVGYFFD